MSAAQAVFLCFDASITLCAAGFSKTIEDSHLTTTADQPAFERHQQPQHRRGTPSFERTWVIGNWSHGPFISSQRQQHSIEWWLCRQPIVRPESTTRACSISRPWSASPWLTGLWTSAFIRMASPCTCTIALKGVVSAPKNTERPAIPLPTIPTSAAMLRDDEEQRDWRHYQGNRRARRLPRARREPAEIRRRSPSWEVDVSSLTGQGC